MSSQNLVAIANDWISLWCTPVNWELFDRLHSDVFQDCASAGRESTKSGFAAGLAELTQAFPDLMTMVDDLIVDLSANKVAVRWTARGTNALRYMNVGPTHKPTVIRGIEIIEIDSGQIIRRWGEWDISDHAET